MVCEDGSLVDGTVIVDYDWQKICELLSYETNASEGDSHFSGKEKSSDEIDSSGSPAIKPKKKRLRPDKLKYKVSLFPRVIKRDVRRLFPQMVANVWNSSDPALFRAFFETFATSSFCVSGIPEVVLDDSNGVVKQPPKDMDGLVSHYQVEQDLMVDVVVHIEESGIKQFLHRSNRSQVIIQYQIRGTKLYEYKTAPEATLLPPIDPKIAQHTPQCSGKGLLEDPVSVSMRGVITLDMDDQYRIDSFNVNILSSP